MGSFWARTSLSQVKIARSSRPSEIDILELLSKSIEKHVLQYLKALLAFFSFILAFWLCSRFFSIKLTTTAKERAKLFPPLPPLPPTFSSARLPVRIEYYLPRIIPSQIPVKHLWQNFGVQSPPEPPCVNCNTFNNNKKNMCSTSSVVQKFCKRLIQKGNILCKTLLP